MKRRNFPDVVFGIPAVMLPLSGFPEGRVRICARNNDHMRIYVKTSARIIGFYVVRVAGYFCPLEEFAWNERRSTSLDEESLVEEVKEGGAK